MTTKSEKIAADIAALMRARNPLLWIVTREEARAERYIAEAAASAGYMTRLWDVAQGFTDLSGEATLLGNDAADPGAALNFIKSLKGRSADRCAWVMRDLPAWLGGPGGAATLRQLRNLARSLPGLGRQEAQVIVVLTTTAEVPPDLAGHATVVEWPLPDREEIAALLDATVGNLPDDIKAGALVNGSREGAIDAAVGLTGEEAQATFARSLVQLRKIDPAIVAKEKRRVVARERVLEWFDPIPGGLDSVGGLENLKAWLRARSTAYSVEARAYGLPSPKGALLVGVPGCGKSLTAKAIATAWQVPLLRVDLGALKSKFVGESESNLRKAFAVIEAIGRCVVWFDEIEKALAGATSGAADGGVSSDALGAILSWMQERTTPSFVIATSNDVSSLPPELLRKGRFDEVWFVDLPNGLERAQVLRSALAQHGRGNLDVSYAMLSERTEGFTGSEIAALIPDAMFAAFNDGAREITTADLIAAAKTVVPLATTAREKIDALRAWAKTRARPATAPTETAAATSGARKIDI